MATLALLAVTRTRRRHVDVIAVTHPHGVFSPASKPANNPSARRSRVARPILALAASMTAPP
jgi:hypothetical protein